MLRVCALATLTWLTMLGCSRGGGASHGSEPSADAAPGLAHASASCDARDLPKIMWSLKGTVSRDFAVMNYMDDDPSPAIRDFTGQVGQDAITYDGHDGIDVGIGGFPKMDEGVAFFAGLDGVVQSATPLSGGAPVILHGDAKDRRMSPNFNWRFFFTLGTPGTWLLELAVNDEVLDRRPWFVTPAR